MFYLFFIRFIYIEIFQLDPYYITPEDREVEVSQGSGPTRDIRMHQALIALGLDLSNSEAQSLQEEVDSYLAVSSRQYWDSIAFWEVCNNINLVNANLYNL